MAEMMSKPTLPFTPAQIKALVQHLPQSRLMIQLRPQWTKKLQTPTTSQTKASRPSSRGTWQSC